MCFRCLCLFSCFLKTSYRLIARFFLHLRSIYHDRQFARQNHPTVSTLSSIRTHPFWRGENRVTDGFSVGLGAETSIYGGLANHNERGISQAEMVDVEFAMELRTRHDKDLDNVKLAADIIPADKK